MDPQNPDPQAVASLIYSATNFQAAHYFSIAGATLLFYDYLLCLPSGMFHFPHNLIVLTGLRGQLPAETLISEVAYPHATDKICVEFNFITTDNTLLYRTILAYTMGDIGDLS